MTQESAILYLLRSGPKTTNELIDSPFRLAAEYRRTISDLRRKGYVIAYARGQRGTGTYTLVSEPMKTEPSGQMVAFA